MAVKATTFDSTSDTTDTDNMADELAKNAGFNTMDEYEQLQETGPISNIEMQLHENNALLAASGDSYPFTYQFNPVDGESDVGLYFDPTNQGQFESFDMNTFLDFNDPALGMFKGT
jgi:hypothetical protein